MPPPLLSPQAGYRSYRARKYFLALREKSLGIFHGNKRRRGSWALYFLGDYVHASDSLEVAKLTLQPRPSRWLCAPCRCAYTPSSHCAQVAKLMQKEGDQRILFADVATKVNRNRKSQERALLITERALYTLTPGKWKVTNRVPLECISDLSMSTFADGFFVVHVTPDCPGMAAWSKWPSSWAIAGHYGLVKLNLKALG
tara:strand:- start:749 stop:1345 length:597 start_codon:yes stop_codon:yes gene_type:complete